MPINWGLRRILGVNPGDRTCVGYAPSKNRRCTKPINKHDWPAACRLLDQMDRLEDLRDAIEDLEELAGLLLCNEWHNSLSRPQHSQVDKMYRKWKGIVEEYVRLREQEDRAAERQAQRLREGEREREAQREAERRSIATEVMTELEEEQLDTVCYLDVDAIFEILMLSLCRFVPLDRCQHYLPPPMLQISMILS